MKHINKIVLFSHKEWDYGGGAGETVSRLSVCLHLWRSELDLPGLMRKLGPVVHVSNPSAPTVRWENTGESPKATGTTKRPWLQTRKARIDSEGCFLTFILLPALTYTPQIYPLCMCVCEWNTVICLEMVQLKITMLSKKKTWLKKKSIAVFSHMWNPAFTDESIYIWKWVCVTWSRSVLQKEGDK